MDCGHKVVAALQGLDEGAEKRRGLRVSSATATLSAASPLQTKSDAKRSSVLG